MTLTPVQARVLREIGVLDEPGPTRPDADVVRRETEFEHRRQQVQETLFSTPVSGRGRGRPVYCVETGEVWQSVSDCARSLDIAEKRIRNAIDRRKRVAGRTTILPVGVEPASRPITLTEAVQRVQTRNTVAEVLEEAAACYGVDIGGMISQDRREPYTLARMAAAAGLRKLGLSYPAMAAVMGQRHHTSVISCYKRVMRIVQNTQSAVA